MSRIPEENKVRYDAEIKAGEQIGHTQTMEGVATADTCVCSCGWRSSPYMDGREWAYADWVRHIEEQGAMILYPTERF